MGSPQTKSDGTDTVYVGIERFDRIREHAIDVSAATRIQVAPSQFAQHLVDFYSDVARDNWMETLAKGQPQVSQQNDDESQDSGNEKQSTSNNCYVGVERFERITQSAIDVSQKSRKHIRPSTFVQHLVDHYSGIASEHWLETLAAKAAK
jgi:post-segregation antitoxin (ccd killing protein)